jgi:fatty acid desaturase
MERDLEHLKLLSIFHYVAAGMAALVACIPFIHFFMGLAMATGVLSEGEPGVRPVGIGIMAFAAFFILAGWTLAILMALAGRSLAARRRYTFCLVIGAVECLFMPVGTVLGVFTIIVLVRESVKGMFQAAAA